MIPTFLTALALGTITTVTAAIIVLSAWVTGSLIVPGNLFFDTTNNLNPGIYINTNKVITLSGSKFTIAGDMEISSEFYTYQEEVLTSSGTGVGKIMNACIQTPYTTTSGSLVRVVVECGGIPTSINMDIGTTTDQFGSGTNIIDNWTVSASGSSLKVPETGTGYHLVGTTLTTVEATLPIIVYDSTTYMCATTTSGATSTLSTDCKLRIWSYERYGSY